MAYINELRNLKAKYATVKAQVTNSKVEIGTLHQDMDKIIAVENEVYSIDSKTADQNFVKNQKAEITKAETLAANVLSAIDNRMSELDSLIAAEEARLAAEAARAKAEAEAAKEAAKSRT